MARLVATEFYSLDGVVENPAWTFAYWNDEIAAFKQEEQSTADVMLLGRVTYQGFAEAWPARREDDDFSRRFNEMEKRVVTSTLTQLDWENSHLLDGASIADGVKALKERAAGDVIVHGSATLVQELLRQGQVDELRLVIYPVTLGAGKRLFDGVDVKLELLDQRATQTGAILARYRPV
jgi:dihydrofolate reductase